MVSATDLVYAEQIADLREVAISRKWDLKELEESCFVLGLPAKNETRLYLFVDCQRFPLTPPAWHWYDPETKEMDQPRDTPKGDNYFHGSGRICAPWNRLAYTSEDAKGPHNDWTLANWMSNPNTRSCTTLSAMALRIYLELQGVHFQGRMA